MKMDNLRRYINLRDSLAREKNRLEQRLQQIGQALGQPMPAPSGARAGSIGTGRRGRPARGGLSLRDAVLQLTSRQPMTKEEILEGVQQLGYTFSTTNPLNSLGVILYGKNPRFKNENGRFSSSGSAGGGAPSASGAFSRKRRQLSPAARERIAAAQRARWAKAKARGK
jgi:hypothetical protein